MLQVISKVLTIAGSLGLFLFGMRTMSEGLQKAAGQKLQHILDLMTVNRVTAVLTGFAITVVIQSSSATTVMVVSFVNAGLFTLSQAIGVIMGANIGTTVTGWLVAIIGFKVNIAAIALPAVGIGIVLFFVKSTGKKTLGEIFIGFGILFLGLALLKDAVPDIKENPEVLIFLANFVDRGLLSFLIFVAAGTLITIIVQSSSAAMAITITMAYSGWIDYPTAAALVLGENIGTTITAFLASIGTTATARRASRAHTLFNLLGVLWMAFLFKPFLGMVDSIIPGDPAISKSLPQHLAMFHTLFNVANTFIFIWFIPYIARIVEKLVPEDREEVKRKYTLEYIRTGLQDTAELSVVNARHEVTRMAEAAEEMFGILTGIMLNPDKKLKKKSQQVRSIQEELNLMQDQISQFLLECLRDNLNEKSSNNAQTMISIVHELDNIGDSCAKLLSYVERRYNKGIEIDKEADRKIAPYTELVQEFLSFNKKNLNKRLSKEELEQAYTFEEEIDGYRNSMKKEAQKRMKTGSNVKAELLYIDILRHIEHVGDYSMNISRALRQFR